MKRHTTEEIVAKAQTCQRLVAGGRRVTECVREIGVTEVTYYRWRNRYGGLESDLAGYLTELEGEIARLRWLVSDLTLEKLVLVETTTGALSPELCASRHGGVWHFGTAGLPGTWPAPINATQDTGASIPGSACRNLTKDRRNRCRESFALYCCAHPWSPSRARRLRRPSLSGSAG